MLDSLTIERATAGDAPIMVALSGGGDSSALLVLLAEKVGAARLTATIVDHALRRGSADDAQRARDFAERLGVSAQILTLTWETGGARSQQAARLARYRALCDHARTLGARVIALAHTADDQAETVLMRAAAGSSWRGLAGMASLAPPPVWPEGRGLVLARPLLAMRRQALRDLLRARGFDWVEDPANANHTFERVRTRAKLAELEAAAFDPGRLATLAIRLRRQVERLDAAAAALIADTARFHEDAILLSRDRLHEANPAVWARALSALLTAAAGAPRAPQSTQVERLAGEIAGGDFRGATLGGAYLANDAAFLRITRDPGALLGRAGGSPPLAPLPLQPGREAVWDGRLALRASETGWSLRLEAGVPVLRRGDERRPIAAAEPRWLLAERAAQLLGQLH